ncbi:MAG: 30S ribosomal protein S12 methylthiotransferase RimO [Candidatus Omnitrophota bacterium]
MAKVGIVSLGCPRNLVDSEVMVGSLKRAGFELTDIENGVDICLVNTCSFIDSAREESIDAILQAASLKRDGKIRHMVVAGCLAQLGKKELLKDIPEIDLLIGTNDFHRIGELVKGLGHGVSCAVSRKLDHLYTEDSPRSLLTPKHYAYVKIAEGCDNSCSYCIISRLRGSFRSRPMASIAGEIKRLSAGGDLREIDLIAQDTTLFGRDRPGKETLPALLRTICRMRTSVGWIRLLYTHPAHYSDDLIDTIAHEGKICKYLDIPVQHVSDSILKRMNRHTTKKAIIGLLEKIRKNVRGVTLRTSIITGFPGETEEEFRELIDFVKRMRFERLGVFIYSREDGTRAAGFRGQVPEKVKMERYDELMKTQKAISAELNRSFLGETIKVLVDEKISGEKDRFLGRSEGDAPEVDGAVYITGKGLRVGDFCRVRITDTLEYDLVGESV